MPDSPPNGITLSVVIPAYNEDLNLENTVADCTTSLDATTLRRSYELLVVNDGSSDDTGVLAERLADRFPHVVAVHRQANGGLGAALRTGFEHSRGRLVSFCPGDGEFGVEGILHLHRQIGNADLIVSRRQSAMTTQPEKRPLHRDVLSFGYRTLTRLLTGVDPSQLTGIYMVKGDFVRQLQLTCKTGNVILEIYRHALREGKTIRHTKTSFTLRTKGTSKVTNLPTILRTFNELVRLRLKAY